MGFYKYIRRSLEKILQKAGKDGELKFMFARPIAPYNIETILALLHIKGIINTIDKYEYEVNNVILDILQWGDDKFSFYNQKKKIFVRPQILYSKSRYNIAVESKSQLKKNIKIIRDVYLDVNKISEMAEETKLTYMNESLNYLRNRGKVTNGIVNILDFWGLATLYYIGGVSKRIFEINNYKIEEFEDKIELVNKEFKNGIKIANKVEYKISGYKLSFEYNDKQLRFRIYDASHIYKEESKKYKMEMNPYIALALLSGSGYVLLEEDPRKPSAGKKTRRLYKEAKNKTGYDILPLELYMQKLIKRRIIGEENYVKFISKNITPYIINTIRYIYGI
ncbi:hypothetical protein DDW05_01020 [Candidatus Nanobsidianus stetteri]|uniref:Uncharacterized protein n=1 Tax=Nanobsidianus stetteri TaxID=1294122 RepID=A0A2T9WUK2_NANST|nr:hypothetical protein DDW05_01020 [Candidatus Nanobsidianus stetteri]